MVTTFLERITWYKTMKVGDEDFSDMLVMKNTINSVISGYFKKRTPLINGYL